MTINFNNNTIELNSTEMKNAMIYGSDTYKDLQAARRDYPNYKVVEIKTKRSNIGERGSMKMEPLFCVLRKKEKRRFPMRNIPDLPGEYARSARPFSRYSL